MIEQQLGVVAQQEANQFLQQRLAAVLIQFLPQEVL
jgi:hypothetical protein